MPGSDRTMLKENKDTLPNIRIAIFAKTLVVETVNLGDLSGLVITPQYGDPMGIANL